MWSYKSGHRQQTEPWQEHFFWSRKLVLENFFEVDHRTVKSKSILVLYPYSRPLISKCVHIRAVHELPAQSLAIWNISWDGESCHLPVGGFCCHQCHHAVWQQPAPPIPCHHVLWWLWRRNRTPSPGLGRCLLRDYPNDNRLCPYHWAFGRLAKSCRSNCAWINRKINKQRCRRHPAADVVLVSTMATSPTVSTVNFIQLEDKSTGMQFLVDTGTALSLLPHKSTMPCSGPCLVGANGSNIKTQGFQNRTVTFSRNSFTFKFFWNFKNRHPAIVVGFNSKTKIEKAFFDILRKYRVLRKTFF